MLCLHPVPDGPEAKIRMSCSSIQCPETSLALHSDCYDKLEKLLIQAAAGNARCRNWSEAQVDASIILGLHIQDCISLMNIEIEKLSAKI